MVNPQIAFVFTRPPHGSARGREGLDALLASATVCSADQLAVFFLQQGVLHLLPQQQPQAILARDYITTFNLLELYEIKRIYVCTDALLAYGLTVQQPLLLHVERFNAAQLRQHLAHFDQIFTF